MKRSLRGLIRSQFYSLLSESKIIVIIYLVSLVACILISVEFVMTFLLGELGRLSMKFSGSLIFGIASEIFGVIGLIFTLIVSGLFVSRDFNDKTINYEVMTGHSRKEIFISRSIVSLIVAGVGGAVMMMTVPLLSALIFGWGDSIPLSSALGMIFLELLFYLRVTSEVIFISIILRHTHLVYIAIVLTGIIEITIGSMLEGSHYALSNSATEGIMHLNTFTLTHADESTEFFFDTAYDPLQTFFIIAFYIAIIAVMLYCSCRSFERSDLE